MKIVTIGDLASRFITLFRERNCGTLTHAEAAQLLDERGVTFELVLYRGGIDNIYSAADVDCWRRTWNRLLRMKVHHARIHDWGQMEDERREHLRRYHGVEW